MKPNDIRELEDLKLPDIRLTGKEIPRKNLTQETCPDRGTNPGSLRDRRAQAACSKAVVSHIKQHYIQGVNDIDCQKIQPEDNM